MISCRPPHVPEIWLFFRVAFLLTAFELIPITSPALAGRIWDGGGNDNWTSGANWNDMRMFPLQPINTGDHDMTDGGEVPYSASLFGTGSVSDQLLRIFIRTDS